MFVSLNTEEVRCGGAIVVLAAPALRRVKTKLHGGAADDDNDV